MTDEEAEKSVQAYYIVKNPHAPGTSDGCTRYQDFNGRLPGLNSCRIAAWLHQVRLEELLAWNPILEKTHNCQLLPSYSYCVQGGPYVKEPYAEPGMQPKALIMGIGYYDPYFY
jgi:hypothetical protein